MACLFFPEYRLAGWLTPPFETPFWIFNQESEHLAQFSNCSTGAFFYCSPQTKKLVSKSAEQSQTIILQTDPSFRCQLQPHSFRWSADASLQWETLLLTAWQYAEGQFLRVFETQYPFNKGECGLPDLPEHALWCWVAQPIKAERVGPAWVLETPTQDADQTTSALLFSEGWKHVAASEAEKQACQQLPLPLQVYLLQLLQQLRAKRWEPSLYLLQRRPESLHFLVEHPLYYQVFVDSDAEMPWFETWLSQGAPALSAQWFLKCFAPVTQTYFEPGSCLSEREADFWLNLFLKEGGELTSEQVAALAFCHLEQGWQVSLTDALALYHMQCALKPETLALLKSCLLPQSYLAQTLSTLQEASQTQQTPADLKQYYQDLQLWQEELGRYLVQCQTILPHTAGQSLLQPLIATLETAGLETLADQWSANLNMQFQQSPQHQKYLSEGSGLTEFSAELKTALLNEAQLWPQSELELARIQSWTELLVCLDQAVARRQGALYWQNLMIQWNQSLGVQEEPVFLFVPQLQQALSFLCQDLQLLEQVIAQQGWLEHWHHTLTVSLPVWQNLKQELAACQFPCLTPVFAEQLGWACQQPERVILWLLAGEVQPMPDSTKTTLFSHCLQWLNLSWTAPLKHWPAELKALEGLYGHLVEHQERSLLEAYAHTWWQNLQVQGLIGSDDAQNPLKLLVALFQQSEAFEPPLSAQAALAKFETYLYSQLNIKKLLYSTRHPTLSSLLSHPQLLTWSARLGWSAELVQKLQQLYPSHNETQWVSQALGQELGQTLNIISDSALLPEETSSLLILLEDCYGQLIRFLMQASLQVWHTTTDLPDSRFPPPRYPHELEAVLQLLQNPDQLHPLLLQAFKQSGLSV